MAQSSFGQSFRVIRSIFVIGEIARGKLEVLFSAFLAVPLSLLKIKGVLTRFDDEYTVSGNTVERYFCRECGSPSYVRVARAPNTAYVFSELFNDADDLLPKVHGWTSQKHRSIEIEATAPQFLVDPGLFPE